MTSNNSPPRRGLSFASPRAGQRATAAPAQSFLPGCESPDEPELGLARSGYARFDKDGYEVSSAGDSRFSALTARLAGGRTIEEVYQCDTKGYQPGGRDWRLGKGKPPLHTVDLWAEYLGLWRQWAAQNPDLIEDLRRRSAGRVLTDRFASSPISQARALAQILVETPAREVPRAETVAIAKPPQARIVLRFPTSAPVPLPRTQAPVIFPPQPATRTPGYTGIGSRSTPPDQMQRLRDLAAMLTREGFELRSGAADGADMACEEGCDLAGGAKAIWLPWPGFQNRWPNPAESTFLPVAKAFEMAALLHPRWAMLTRGPRSLHSRNVHQILGHSLDVPSEFVLCWTADGAQSATDVNSKTGGTGTAIRLASQREVPVFNLARDGAEEALHAFLARRQAERAALHDEAIVNEPEPERIGLRFPG